MKKKGDTFLLVGAILSIFIILIMIFFAYTSNDMADKTEIAKDIINGDLDLIKDKTFEETVDYYYFYYKVWFVMMVLSIVAVVIKMVIDILGYITHKKAFYILAIIMAVITGPLVSIFTLIGAIMSLTDKSTDTTNISFNSNINYARPVDNEYGNVVNDISNNNDISNETNANPSNISDEYGSEVKDDKQE